MMHPRAAVDCIFCSERIFFAMMFHLLSSFLSIPELTLCNATGLPRDEPISMALPEAVLTTLTKGIARDAAAQGCEKKSERDYSRQSKLMGYCIIIFDGNMLSPGYCVWRLYFRSTC